MSDTILLKQSWFFFFLMRLTNLSCIDSVGWSKTFLLLLLRALFSVSPSAFTFLLPIKWLKNLGFLVLKDCWFRFLKLRPRFFYFKVFQWVVFGPTVSFNNAGTLVVLTLLVCFFDKWRGLQACLSFNIDCFFNYFHSIF